MIHFIFIVFSLILGLLNIPKVLEGNTFSVVLLILCIIAFLFNLYLFAKIYFWNK